MFYCHACARKNGWPTDLFLPRSRGRCEVCDKVDSSVGWCFDVPSRNLPIPQVNEPDPQDVQDAIESIKKELE